MIGLACGVLAVILPALALIMVQSIWGSLLFFMLQPNLFPIPLWDGVGVIMKVILLGLIGGGLQWLIGIKGQVFQALTPKWLAAKTQMRCLQ